MRRAKASIIVLTLVGFVVGLLYRVVFNTGDEPSVANFTRSGFHGAGLAFSAWATHLYFTSRSSAWLTRWPLALELAVRTIAMAFVVTAVASTLQVALYDMPIPHGWFRHDFPRIMAVSFAMSLVINGAYELTRLIGTRVLFNFLIGRYRRPIREQRVLLFLDLAGSTSLAEAMGEVRVQDLLTRFFYDIDAAITDHGGEVHAYVGDEVIVTWRVKGDQQQSRYLDCFFAIQDRIAASADQYRAEFALVPDFRAGMHAGPVVISECGNSHRQVAYFGDTMNVAARLQGLCKEMDRGLLVSGELLRLSKPAADLVIETLGPTQLRGRAAPIDVFAVDRRRAKSASERSSLGGSPASSDTHEASGGR
ncbi:adenylate/guanylate cyclase domain-containing protein [Bradyrhizobium sp. Tv2a-2]|uniref:adenylate/guanylate cyclase domain-containing protein n=1 Tax=Bradyrhizobium sp. Tv2a-2 TaxID=113395 RepID=UPI000466B1AA|nr:adenylate/guanylate cyclase domain-containing protein [Bradyrhizobium sp. Tv2a-2]